MSAVTPTPQTQAQQSVSVRIEALRKSYAGVPVLRGISFEVQRGETFVIMGPSGSGKSVLLKHIIGLEPPDAGEILIEGESIVALAQAADLDPDALGAGRGRRGGGFGGAHERSMAVEAGGSGFNGRGMRGRLTSRS